MGWELGDVDVPSGNGIQGSAGNNQPLTNTKYNLLTKGKKGIHYISLKVLFEPFIS